jgi:hypothetical protein
LRFIVLTILISNLYAQDNGIFHSWSVHAGGINGISISYNPVYVSSSELSNASDFYSRISLGYGGIKVGFGWLLWSGPDGPRPDILLKDKIWPVPFFPMGGFSFEAQLVRIYNNGDNLLFIGGSKKNDYYFGIEMGLYLLGAVKFSIYKSFNYSDELFCVGYGFGL